jgi:hypothetical protein
MASEDYLDRFAIRELVENWVLYRDAGDFDRFATLWHDNGRMITTWFEASAPDFIDRSRKAFEAGTRVLHMQGAITMDVVGDRAIAQSKMEIVQRATVHDILVDVQCRGRFYDFIEKRDDRWGFVLRQPIYELDHMFPVDHAARLELDPEVLGRFPDGYCHLAYLQTGMGFTVRTDLPGTRGPEVEALYARGKSWLAGNAIS